jgi:predicted dehydrogenase
LTNDPIRESSIQIAILGGGRTSAVGRAHASAISLLGNVEIAAGCFSTDKSENLLSAKMWRVKNERVYPDLETLISNERGKISTVVVLTPTQNHFEEVLKILRSGMHVICEKSMCSSVNEAEELVSAAYENKVKLFVTFNYTGYPMVREIREMVNQGVLGKIHTVNAIMPQEGFAKKTLENESIKPQDWRLMDLEVPTISLDLGVHLANLVTFMTNLKFEELVAVQNKRGNFDVIDDVHVISKLNNSASCNLWYTKAALGNRNGLSIELYGELGSVTWLQESPEGYIYTDTYGNKNFVNRGTQGLAVANSERYLRFKPGHPSGFIEAFANYYEDIIEELIMVNSNKFSYTFTGVDALDGLLVMEAISKSARLKKWVTLDAK